MHTSSSRFRRDNKFIKRRLFRVPPTLSAVVLLVLVVALGCAARNLPSQHNLVPTESSPLTFATETQISGTATPGSEYPCIPLTQVQTGYVVRVIDGDTIVVNIAGQDYRVRYIGMNAPEVGTDGADEATDLNSSLVLNKTVQLYRDVSDTDKYGRLLRYVVVDGKFVDYELVVQGMAKAGYWEPDTACRETLEEAEAQAQSSYLGIWGK